VSERSDMPIAFPAPSSAESGKGERAESRKQARFAFSEAVEVFDLRSNARVNGRCSDLSAGGCYIDTLSPFPPGAFVKIRMERDKREFMAAAVVAYAHASMGMGLAFTEMKREHWDVLRSWIAELSGEQPPEPTLAKTGPPEAEPETATANADSDASLRLVLNELIYLLARKKVITEAEASKLLHQMFR
jgi:PilZ domain-containing protein